MVCSGLRLDEHVIHVDLHCLANLLLEHHVDEMLIGRSDILKTERHDFIIIQPAVCNEGSVFLVGDMHQNLVIPGIGIHEA